MARLILCFVTGKVHLTGYQIDDEDDDEDFDESAIDSSMLEEASSEEEDDEGFVDLITLTWIT